MRAEPTNPPIIEDVSTAYGHIVGIVIYKSYVVAAVFDYHENTLPRKFFGHILPVVAINGGFQR